MAKKIAVISGGTSGIGKRLVTMFVKTGCKVVTFSRKKSKFLHFNDISVELGPKT